jgi:hypothetical protein
MLAGLVLAALVLPAAAPTLAQADPLWTIASANAEITAELLPSGSGCRLEVRRGQTLLWSLRRCVAERSDYRFVSNDGRSLLVFFTFPAIEADLGEARVGELYTRGKLARRFTLGQFVADLDKLVKTRRHLYWLEGALGQPGVPPGFGRDGKQVELTTLDRRAHLVGFDGRVKGPPFPKRKVKRRR